MASQQQWQTHPNRSLQICGSRCELAYALGVAMIDASSRGATDLSAEEIENLIKQILNGSPPIGMTFIRGNKNSGTRRSLRDLYFDL